MMPTLNASTSAIFAAAGIEPQSFYTVLLSLVGMAYSMGIWLIQVSWPFLLILGFLGLVWGIAHKFRFFGRGGGN